MTDDIDEPFLCRVVPIGMTIFEIWPGIPMLEAACKFAGMVAKLLQVLKAVRVGNGAWVQKLFTPFFPLAIKAYSEKNIKK